MLDLYLYDLSDSSQDSDQVSQRVDIVGRGWTLDRTIEAEMIQFVTTDKTKRVNYSSYTSSNL